MVPSMDYFKAKWAPKSREKFCLAAFPHGKACQCNQLFSPTHVSISPIFCPEEHLERFHASVAIKGPTKVGDLCTTCRQQ